MAMTVRLSDQLRREVGQYSEREGLTVNALIAVALREYLDRRRLAMGTPGTGGNSVPPAPMGLAVAIARRVQGPPVKVGKVKKGRR